MTYHTIIVSGFYSLYRTCITIAVTIVIKPIYIYTSWMLYLSIMINSSLPMCLCQNEPPVYKFDQNVEKYYIPYMSNIKTCRRNYLLIEVIEQHCSSHLT